MIYFLLIISGTLILLFIMYLNLYIKVDALIRLIKIHNQIIEEIEMVKKRILSQDKSINKSYQFESSEFYDKTGDYFKNWGSWTL